MEKQSLPKKKPRRHLGESQSIVPPVTDNHFLRCADLILPWLDPRELASVSQTCKALSFISRSLTLLRSLDAARSLEPLPVPFLNAVDSKRYADFLYTPFQIPATSPLPPRHWWGSKSRTFIDSVNGRFEVSSLVDSDSMYGCECERCEEGYCECLAGTEEIANECGSGCGCGSDCPNRVTQKGISVRLKVVRDEKKGWCLCSDQLIKKGQFICEYAGELLTTAEARRRQTIYDKLRSSTERSFSSALLVIREHLPSGRACLRLNIDATSIGNVARFINHSCDGGNLSTVLLRSAGALLPRLCFFAARDVVAGEELSFSYGDVRLAAPGKSAGDNELSCSCGSSCCFGTLPSENT
ncbi:histone-lysine N-methyltransferase SUVR3-like [Raphanus sativus]|uniref:Histone-lysine N-methyltransferase SUVR3-like n=1 Tax=Raphanus sativus TaxID=3726 RepID=A0A9W3BRH6_RAPSA|nr:histone-lysine N-methyltransferase SUVR3-like [Raphanus sativus]